ncbi:hypothetical protein KFE98_19130 [bacterium SCSIO 12741]|nr:hypothetical protein KFE98_19130 [bacterium SCSIO 12741]
MKSKPVKITLLIGVVAIWGLIAYQILAPASIEDDNLTFAMNRPVAQVSEEKREVVDLQKNYADPFFKKMAYQPPSNPIQPVTQKKRAKPVIAKPVKIWPPVVYNGTVKNHTTGNLYAFFEINGRKEALEEMEEFESIKVLKIWKDSVLLEFENQQRTIHK